MFTRRANETLDLNNRELARELDGNDVILLASNDIEVNANVTRVQAGNNDLTDSLTMEAGRSITIADGVNIILEGGNFSATINASGASASRRDVGQAEFTMGTNSSIVTSGGFAGHDDSFTSGVMTDFNVIIIRRWMAESP